MKYKTQKDNISEDSDLCYLLTKPSIEYKHSQNTFAIDESLDFISIWYLPVVYFTLSIAPTLCILINNALISSAFSLPKLSNIFKHIPLANQQVSILSCLTFLIIIIIMNKLHMQGNGRFPVRNGTYAKVLFLSSGSILICIDLIYGSIYLYSGFNKIDDTLLAIFDLSLTDILMLLRLYVFSVFSLASCFISFNNSRQITISLLKLAVMLTYAFLSICFSLSLFEFRASYNKYLNEEINNKSKVIPISPLTHAYSSIFIFFKVVPYVLHILSGLFILMFTADLIDSKLSVSLILSKSISPDSAN